MSLRDKILSKQDLRYEKVHIAEWDVEIEVRGLTGAQRGELIGRAKDGELDSSDLMGEMVELVIRTVYDPETGDRVFTNDDKAALLERNGEIIERLASIASDLSGITSKAVEDAEKN